MRIVKLAALGGAVLASAGLLVPSVDAAAEQPSAAPAVATRTVAVDVDGDGKADQVTIEQSAVDTFAVNVVTAAGQDAVRLVTSTIVEDWGIEPWYGAAKLDHVKGHELLLLTAGGDGVGFRVLTWRGGDLVLERAPGSVRKGTYDWYLADLATTRFGYRFESRDGRRYVRDFELYRSGRHWTGTVVTSVWKGGHWTTLHSAHVTLTKKQAGHYRGLSGVTVVARP